MTPVGLRDQPVHGGRQEQALERVAVPALEPGAAPAAIHDEEAVGLGAADRRRYGARSASRA